MYIVLVEPEIPQNTGNIARTCAATGTPLYLVGKLGFSIEEKHVKRAGLDYWKDVDIRRRNTLDEVMASHPDAPFFCLSTKARRLYSDISYPTGAFLVFGRETAGLGEETVTRFGDNALRVPMRPGMRSLNLANTVALVLYEALRQQGFAGLI